MQSNQLKYINFIEKRLYDKDFQDDLVKIRKTITRWDTGITLPDYGLKVESKFETEKDLGDYIYNVIFNYELSEAKNSIQKFSKKNKITDEHILLTIVFFNKIFDLSSVSESITFYDMGEIYNLSDKNFTMIDYENRFLDNNKKDAERFVNMQDFQIDLLDKPFAILFSPQTTAKDLKEYIDANFKSEIEPKLQKGLKSKNIKQSRNRDDIKQDLRDLIYENRHLKIGKIKEIANHKRNTDKEYVDKRYFDDSYVRKILKEEITKRGK